VRKPGLSSLLVKHRQRERRPELREVKAMYLIILPIYLRDVDSYQPPGLKLMTEP
jgi:hypothetical protein